MKSIILALSFASLAIGCGLPENSALTQSNAAHAQLTCTTDGALYYESFGKIVLTADIESETLLSHVSLKNEAGGHAGFTNARLEGHGQGNYVRFSAADAWVNYKITLTKGFLTRTSSVMFIDAYGDGTNGVNTLRMKCQR